MGAPPSQQQENKKRGADQGHNDSYRDLGRGEKDPPQKIGQYIEIFSQYVKTDLELSEMLWFVEPAMGFDLDNISNATLPGDSTVTYKGWTYCHQLDREKTLEIINEMVNPYTTPVTLEMTNMPQK